jgi:hypothetical protein
MGPDLLRRDAGSIALPLTVPQYPGREKVCVCVCVCVCVAGGWGCGLLTVVFAWALAIV